MTSSDEEKDKQLESEEEDYSLLRHKTFITPMVVSTVDQLLYCMFNHGRWDISLSNVYNSTIIFDEIHTYDFYTLGLIMRTIEMLKNYDINFCFMSATFPMFLEERIKEVLDGNIKSIEDDERFGNNIKVKIIQRDEYLTGVISEIIKNFELKRKVLVICNTVKQSRDIYLTIKEKLGKKNEDKIMLYHSQFIVKDREEKEERLEKIPDKVGFIAITTQVVEVSLDLDFDVLFTEIAPIDAVVQRIGRVNRRGKKGICDVFVFKYDESQIRGKDERWYYPYTKETLDLSWELLNKKVKTKNGALTYLDYKDLVDKLYKQIEEKDWRPKFDEGKKIIGEILNCLDWIYRCNLEETGIEAKTRDSPIIYVETIPYQFEDEIIRRIHEKKGRLSLSKMIIPYLVRVPLYKVKGRVHLNSQIGGHMFLEVGYDDKIGVHFDYDHKDNII
ncbi:MAG: CRISPR-associated helicase Cas3' [Nitrososphaerales archaeon]